MDVKIIYDERALSELINTGFCRNNFKDRKHYCIIDCLNDEFLLDTMSY